MIAENEILEQALAAFQAILIVFDDTGLIHYLNHPAEMLLVGLSANISDLTLDKIFPTLKNEELPHEWKEAHILKIAEQDFVAFAEKIPDMTCLKRIVLTLMPLSILDPVTRELIIMKRELEQLIDCSYDEIFITDGVGTVLRVSAEACRRLYGVEPEQIIGRNVKELEAEGYFSPSIFDQIVDEKRRITTIQSNKMGQKTIVTVNPILDGEGNILRVVSNSRDITEFINLSEQIQTSEKQVQRFYKNLVKIKQDSKVIDNFVAESPNMRSVIDMGHRVANFDSTVLLLGESGVGKDLVAKLIHNLSHRSDGPFRKINCGAIPDSLLESELFGYSPGAFTGALKEGKKGLIEEAQGGTLYLDEIGEMPYCLQVKLLQVIEEKIVMRVGSSMPKPLDVRIIAATHKNLKEMISRNKFREDLYYRLNVVLLHLPPLRERPEDLRALCSLFIDRFNTTFKKTKGISPEVMNSFYNYTWPGNVRELENLIERFLVMSDENTMLLKHLPDYIVIAKERRKENDMAFSPETDTGTIAKYRRLGRIQLPKGSTKETYHLAKISSEASSPPESGTEIPLKEAVEKAEVEAILQALEKHGRISKAAEALGVSQSTLVRRFRKFGIKIDHAKVKFSAQE